MSKPPYIAPQQGWIYDWSTERSRELVHRTREQFLANLQPHHVDYVHAKFVTWFRGEIPEKPVSIYRDSVIGQTRLISHASMLLPLQVTVYDGVILPLEQEPPLADRTQRDINPQPPSYAQMQDLDAYLASLKGPR